MKDVLRFWLRKGADGFRIDAIPFIFESAENADGYYDDEPRSGECNDDPEVGWLLFFYPCLFKFKLRDISNVFLLIQASCYLNHTQTKDQDETYTELYGWRDVMEEEEFSDYTR